MNEKNKILVLLSLKNYKENQTVEKIYLKKKESQQVVLTVFLSITPRKRILPNSTM